MESIKQTRTVEVNTKKIVDGKWENVMYTAEWHMFAQETEEDSAGNIQYPVAILELPDGRVVTEIVNNIRFIKED